MKRRGLYRFLTRFFVGGREGWRGGFCFSPFFSLLGGVVVGVLRHSREQSALPPDPPDLAFYPYAGHVSVEYFLNLEKSGDSGEVQK